MSDYYGTQANLFRQRGWTVVSPDFDWRGDLAHDAARLRDLLFSLSAAAPVHIVAHSRGGLVTRAALALLQATGDIGLVGRVAGLGVPHHGSWDAAALLCGWNTLARYLRALLFGIETIAVGALLAGDLQHAINSWPAIYQLLPDPGILGSDQAGASSLYNPAWWTDAGVPIASNWLIAAPATWAALPPIPQGIQWLHFIGQGIPTAVSLVSEGPPLSSQDVNWSFAGDGSVPAAWAAIPAQPTVTTPTSHRALAYDGRVVSAVHDWFSVARIAASPLPGGILN